MSDLSLTASLEETLDIFDSAGPPLSTPEVADRLDLGRRSTYNRLEQLVDRGCLETKKVGASARVWWREDAGSNPNSGTASLGQHHGELQRVFERIDDAFLAVDDDWTLTYVNERAATILDWTSSDLVGRNIWEAFPGAIESTFQAQYERARETGESVSFEEYYPPMETWFEVTAYPSESGLSVYFRDVTGRKQRERELERYERIVETVEEGIYVVDDSGQFVDVNGSYAEMLGRDPADLIGTSAAQVVDDSVAEEARRMESKLLEGDRETAALEAEMTTAAGDRLVGEATFALIETESGHERIGVVRDVTERRERKRDLELYERIVETLEDGIYAVDDADRFVLVNDAFCELTGYDAEQLVGEHSRIVRASTFEASVESVVSQVTDGDRSSASVEVDLETNAGAVVPTETRIAPFSYGAESGRCGVVRDISARLEREGELQKRLEQLQVVSRLGQRALEERNLDRLMHEAVRSVAETLDTEYAKVLELQAEADSLLLRQGVGWDPGVNGSATVSAIDDDSQAAYTLRATQPVVVENLETETRFSGPDLLTDHGVRSGISTIIGPWENPWGILGTHDTESAEFSEHDVNFVQSVANVLASAIARHDDEQALLQQREQLEALNELNVVVREVTSAVIEESTRAEIEQRVCHVLSNLSSYRFAWIGDVESGSQAVHVRAEAGADDYLDGTSISVDPDADSGMGPTGRAFRTGSIQTVQNVSEDSTYEPWRDHAESHDVRSSAAIPIVHDETVYGVLNVYADRVNAFEGQERSVISQLGEVVGHAIVATERKQALMGDRVTELDLCIGDVFTEFGVDEAPPDTVTIDQAVPVAEDKYLIYGRTTAASIASLERITDAVDVWEELTVRGDGDRMHFQLRVTEPPALSVIASVGGAVEQAEITDGDYHVTVHLSQTTEVRQFIERLRDAYPSVQLRKRNQLSRVGGSATVPTGALTDTLTDRQRTVLETAYHAGFFEWPRAVSGEEMAESLDISPPTYHQHLRKAQRKVFETLYESSVMSRT